MTSRKKILIAEIAKHRPRLYKLCFSWTHNYYLSEDLAQETITQAINKISSLKDPKALPHWLSKILSNKFRNFIKLSRDTDSIDDIILSEQVTPETLYHQDQLRIKIRQAISSLPVGQRMAITLADLEGHSYLEIAEILGTPIGTVMSRLSRARRRLASLLHDEAGQTAANLYTQVINVKK